MLRVLTIAGNFLQPHLNLQKNRLFRLFGVNPLILLQVFFDTSASSTCITPKKIYYPCKINNLPWLQATKTHHSSPQQYKKSIFHPPIVTLSNSNTQSKHQNPAAFRRIAPTQAPWQSGVVGSM